MLLKEMASRGPNHRCYTCNMPHSLNPLDPHCPYCGAFPRELSHRYEDAYVVDPNHRCYSCNMPHSLNPLDPHCPHCGVFPQELSDRFEDAYVVDRGPHADIFARDYHSIFGPTPPRDDNRFDRHVHRPRLIPAPRSNNPIRERIPIGALSYQRYVDEPVVGEQRVDRQLTEDELIRAAMEASLREECRRPPPAVRHLPTIRVSERHLNDEGNCAVCQEKFELNSEAKQMPCRHIYHPDCINLWLERQNTCPVCRFELPTPHSTTSNSRTGSHLRSLNPLLRILPRSFR